MKNIFTAIFLFVVFTANAQYKNPRIQAYISPGVTLVQLSHDDLVQAKKQGNSRVGDVLSLGLQAVLPLKNNRFAVSAGLGFSQRHFSINKYSLDDFFNSLFLFDYLNPGDSFQLTRVRFTNNYLQAPVAFSFTITKPKRNFQLATGLKLKPDFLISSQAQVDFDSTYRIPGAKDIKAAQKTYTANASRFIFTASPYFEATFNCPKKWGMLFDITLPSFYSTVVDKRLTKSSVELFSFTFGAFYSLK
jgi:hypothetical protein